jgi:hypothetical protein
MWLCPRAEGGQKKGARIYVYNRFPGGPKKGVEFLKWMISRSGSLISTCPCHAFRFALTLNSFCSSIVAWLLRPLSLRQCFILIMQQYKSLNISNANGCVRLLCHAREGMIWCFQVSTALGAHTHKLARLYGISAISPTLSKSATFHNVLCESNRVQGWALAGTRSWTLYSCFCVYALLHRLDSWEDFTNFSFAS